MVVARRTPAARQRAALESGNAFMHGAAESSLREATESRTVDAPFDSSQRCCEILEVLNELLDAEAEPRNVPLTAGA